MVYGAYRAEAGCSYHGRLFIHSQEGDHQPPLWTVTTSSGQRIKQTQDGGKTYGYILSGEMNSAEYDLLASKGERRKTWC